MQFPKIPLLGVSVSLTPRSELLLRVSKYLKSKGEKPFTIFTPNPEQIVDAQSDKTFCEILNSADIAIPDGEGIIFATRILKIKNQKSKIKKISGIDFMEGLCGLAAREKYPVAFIGGRDGVAQKALDTLQKKYPGLTGWAEEPAEFAVSSLQLAVDKRVLSSLESIEVSSQLKVGSAQKNQKYPKQTNDSNLALDDYFDQLAKKINDSEVRLVFVGLGAPKQEYYIKAISSQLSAISNKNLKAESGELKAPVVLMSVGGAFDILSGRIKRAPKFVQQIKLEWLWRLILEPWRIKRQMKLIKYIYLVLKSKK